jgi:hypothetical protein
MDESRAGALKNFLSLYLPKIVAFDFCCYPTLSHFFYSNAGYSTYDPTCSLIKAFLRIILIIRGMGSSEIAGGW